MQTEEQRQPFAQLNSAGPPDHPSELENASPLARFFFTRQIFAILLSFLLIMGGLMGYASMVKESDPEIKNCPCQHHDRMGRDRCGDHRKSGHGQTGKGDQIPPRVKRF